jgi:polysaccharide biosynthesis/export protein
MEASRPNWSRLVLVLGVFGLLWSSSVPLSAQTPTPQQLEQLREQMRGQAAGERGQAEDALRRRDVTADGGAAAGPLLDRTISRTEYLLGPGDRLTLSVFGYRNELFPLTVTPEGTIIIPTIGIVPVGGLNLDAATLRARQRVRRVFPESEVEISLAAVRSFKVFVVGDVPEPGIRTATAVTRVSELVPGESQQGMIYRNITIRRGAETFVVDLDRFRRTGDVADNPFLKEGDVIQVPRIDAIVTVTGEVAYPGRYEFRPGETLADLMRVANAGDRFLARAADTVFLMRFSDNPRGEIQAVAAADAVGSTGQELLLAPFDGLFVPRLANHMHRTTARVEGEVMKPGEYPLQPSITRVRDLVEMAGGFSSEASPGEAILQRHRFQEPAGNDAGLAAVPLVGLPPELLSRSDRQIMQVLSRADERYLIVDIRPGSPTLDLPVAAGDVLRVPRRGREVVVLGAVRRPGLVVYTPGQPVEHFIEAVGGYTRQADPGSLAILRAETGARLQRRDIESVEAGDRIVVPFRERSSFLERVQTTQGIISTFSGLVLTIVGIQRLWEAVAN